MGLAAGVGAELAQHFVGEPAQLGQVGHLEQEPVDAQVAECHHAARAAHPAHGLHRPPGLRVGVPDLLGPMARAADADRDGHLGKQLIQAGGAQGAEPRRTGHGAVLVLVRQHHGHLGVACGDDRVRCPGGEEVLGRGGGPAQQVQRAAGPGAGRLERHRQHVVPPPGVVAEVPGPSAGLRLVLATPGEQALDQVVPHPAGGRGHHPLPAEDDPADGGGVLGEQQAGVLPAALPAGVHRQQVGGHVIADKHRCDDHRGGGARAGQPQRPPGAARGGEDLAEPWVDDDVAEVLGGPLAGLPGGRRGQDVHGGADHGDRRVRPLGDQPGHRGEVSVLDRQPRQVAVYRDEVAQRENLPRRLRARAGIRRLLARRRSDHLAARLVLEHKDMPMVYFGPVSGAREEVRCGSWQLHGMR